MCSRHRLKSLKEQNTEPCLCEIHILAENKDPKQELTQYLMQWLRAMKEESQAL